MPDEKNKNNKKNFIKWLISSLFLTGGATSGILAVSETEEKLEEEEKNQQSIGLGKKTISKKPIAERKKLDKVLTKRNLGTIGTNTDNELPTEEKIKNVLKNNNIDFNTDKVNITDITLTSAKIESSDNNFYIGSVKISFNTIKIIDFSTFNDKSIVIKTDEKSEEEEDNKLVEKNLKEICEGIIINNKLNIIPEKIKTQVNKKNKIIEVSSKDENIYIGKFKIHYSFQKLTNLKDIISENKLGIVYTNNKSPNPATEKEIKDALVMKFNIANIIRKIEITNITPNSFVVSSNNFLDTFEVKYDIFYNSFDFTNIFAQNQKNNHVPTFDKHANFEFLEQSMSSDIFWYKNTSLLRLFLFGKKGPHQFVKDLEVLLKYKANDESIKDFNVKKNKINNFENFEELNKKFKEMKNKDENNYNIDWENILESLFPKNLNLQTEMKKRLFRFYNIMFNIYGKQKTLNIVKKIELSYEKRKIFGSAHFPGDNSNWTPKINLYYHSLVSNDINNIDHIMWTIVHEYGHMLDFFVTKNWNESAAKQMIESFAEPWGISIDEYKQFLAYGIVRSSYGRNNNFKELFAEAFSQWILTPETNQDIAWEKLDNFFRIYLPKKDSFK